MSEMTLTQRSLRAMRERWKADLARLEAAYPVEGWDWSDSETETVRNLATAIAEIDGIIVNAVRLPQNRNALSKEPK